MKVLILYSNMTKLEQNLWNVTTRKIGCYGCCYGRVQVTMGFHNFIELGS